MLQHVLHVYSMNLGFAKRLLSDLSEDQMCAQPHGVVNHPAWSPGHLAVAADHLGTPLGLSSELPAGWEQTFKTGGTPSPDKSFLMTAHEMDHLGQVAAWRRAMGLGSAA